MAVTSEKLIKVLERYSATLDHVEPEEMQDELKTLPLCKVNRYVFECHLAYMCKTTIRYVHEGRVEKAMRWLGFIQASLYILGYCTIEDLKNHSKPDQVDSDCEVKGA